MAVLRRVDGALCSLLPDGFLAIYYKLKGQSLVLPPIASLVWEFCDGSHTVEEITVLVSECLATAGTVPDDLATQVQAIVDRLLKETLVAIEQDDARP